MYGLRKIGKRVTLQKKNTETSKKKPELKAINGGKSALSRKSLARERAPASLRFRFTEKQLSRIDRKLGLSSGISVEVAESEYSLPHEIIVQTEQEGALGEIVAVHRGNSIYVVADRIGSVAELEEAILHEAAHYGGRQLFGKEWREAYTNAWFSLGGINGLKKFAKKHGFAKEFDSYIETANNLIDKGEISARDRAVYLTDEFIAHAQGQKAYRTMPGKVKQAIREFIGAIRNILRSSGLMKTAEMSESDLAFLLRYIHKAARENGPATEDAARFMVRWHGRKPESKAFLPDHEEAEKYRADLKKTMRSLRSKVEPVTLGKTPVVLQAVGAPDLPMSITRDTIRKAINGIKHDIPMNVIEQLPEAIADPVFIVNGSESNSLAVLTRIIDDHGDPVLVSVDLERKQARIVVNRLSSVYGKSRLSGLKAWKKGEILYINKKTSPSWSQSIGVQFPSEDTLKGSSTRLVTDEDIVNEYQDGTTETDATKSYAKDDAEESSVDKKDDDDNASFSRKKNVSRKQGKVHTGLKGKIVKYVKRVLAAGGHVEKPLVIGSVSNSEVDEIKDQTGIDLTGYTREWDASGVRHAYRRHSSKSSRLKDNEVPLTEDSFSYAVDAIKEPDSIKLLPGRNKNNNEVIERRKTLSDGKVIYLEEVRTGRKKLVISSLRIEEPSTTDVPDKSDTSQSYARSGAGSLNIIDKKGDDDKASFSRKKNTLKSSTSRTVFDRYASLGSEKTTAKKAIEDIPNIMGFESPFAIEEVQDLPKNVPMRFNLDTKKIEVSPEAKYSKPIVLQHLVEEILHGIDSVRSRSTISASSKKFNRQTGIVTREALDHYEGGGELSAFLKYPFHHKYKLSDTQTQAELFARLGVVYLGNPGLLKEILPNAYQVYHEIFGLEVETPTDSDRYVFRKVWQGGSARNRKMGSEPGVSRSAGGEASGTDRQGGAGRGLDGIRAAVARASEGSRLGRLVEFWSLDTRYTPEQEAALKKGGFGNRSKKPFTEDFRERRHLLGTKLRQGIVDQYAAFKDILKDNRSWMLAQLTGSSNGALEAAIDYGVPFMNDGAVDVDVKQKSLKEILKPLGEELDDWLAWMAGNRADKLTQQDRERLFSSVDIEALKSLNQGSMKDGSQRGKVYS